MANEKKQAKTVADPEQARRKKEEQARRARRRNRQLLGFVLTILIIWGAVSIVRSGIDLAQNLLDDTEQKQEYLERIEKMVWFDILPFTDASQLDEETLKQIAIWDIYYKKGDELERDENGETLIPVLELDLWAQSLFGNGFSFHEHSSFMGPDHGINYEFLPEQAVYILPGTGLEFNYLPTVVEIKNEGGGTKRVVVGYASARSDSGEPVYIVDYDNPVRYMDFIFKRDGSEYYLVSVERNTSREVAIAETTTSSEAEPAQPEQAQGEDEFLPDVE